MTRTANKRSKYGHAHRKRRQQLAHVVAAGRASCWRCGRPIRPGESWHVGHLPDGTRTAVECVKCNLSDAGRKRAAQLYGRRVATRPGKAPASASQGPGWWRTSYPAGWPADPEPGNTVVSWSRHWAGAEFNPRCPRCRELGRACEGAV